MKIQFCEQKRTIKYKNKVIVNNKRNGQWIKLSRQCYDIIQYAVEHKWTEEKLMNELYDEEDKSYIKKVLEKMEKLGLIFFEQKENKPFALDSITLSITSNCNLKCKHCSLEAGNIEDEVLLDVLRSRAKKIIECNPLNIILTGGEPLHYKYFEEIVTYIRNNYKGNLGLMTNGTLINEENVLFITKNFTNIDISLDGYDKKTSENIRGKKTFDYVKNSVDLLKNNGMKNIVLSMTATKYTCGHEKDFVLLCKQWGVKEKLRRFAPVGRGEKNEDELFCIEQEFYYKQNNNVRHHIDSSESGRFITVCGAFENELYVGADGYIYPCGALCMNDFRVRKIDDIDDLKLYFKNKSYLNTGGYKAYLNIQPENSNKCRECFIRFFCTGCPAYVYLYEKQGYLKQYCENRKMYNKDLIWGENDDEQ